MVISVEKKYFKGFTLAETLITLMVIGILAVVTIPSLMQSWEKMALKSQTKKALATINQAYYQTMWEEGFECYYLMQPNATLVSFTNKNCKNFYDSFFAKLKVAKECKGNALQGGCVPDYAKMDPISGCPSFERDFLNQSAYVRVLVDGVIIFDYGQDNHPIMGIDVNGIKPPNEMGKDILGLQGTKMSNNNSYTLTPFQRLYTCLNLGDPSEYYFKTLGDLYK